MKVLVDALPLRQGGGVTYFQQQMSALADVAPDLDLHTLISPWGRAAVAPGTSEIIRVGSVPTRFAYELVRLPLRKTDLLYCPANFGPVACSSPMILTLHNANYYGAGLRLRESRPSRPWWKIRANRLAMRRADVVVAISQSLAAEVAESVPSVAGKLQVMLSGRSEWPLLSCETAGLPDRYILAVTSSAPHKHLDDVVTGWSRSLDMSSAGCALVTVGHISEQQWAGCRAAAGRHAKLLVHLGPVPDRRRMKWLYEHATALVSMSVLEAFPLTPGEAGSVGCPLVLSDIPAHREVTLGNATFVPPRDALLLADILSSETYAGQPGQRPWTWPSTWHDNGRALADLMRAVG